MLTANYLFFFSRFACFFSFAVFLGAVFWLFLVSCDFDIPFTSYITMLNFTTCVKYPNFPNNAIAILHKRINNCLIDELKSMMRASNSWYTDIMLYCKTGPLFCTVYLDTHRSFLEMRWTCHAEDRFGGCAHNLRGGSAYFVEANRPVLSKGKATARKFLSPRERPFPCAGIQTFCDFRNFYKHKHRFPLQRE